MGWLIVAFGTVFLLIVGHIQNSQRVEVVKMQQSGSSHLLARQLLSLAAGINDWRYRHTLTNGTVALSALALPVTPDSRIRHVIVANRLWVWMPEVPGLVDALREQSGGSALIGTVTKGQLVWLTARLIFIWSTVPAVMTPFASGHWHTIFPLIKFVAGK